MRLLARTITALLVVMASGGCTSIQVTSTHDPKANFSNLRTYAWSRSADTRSSAKAYGWRLRQAVDRQLGAKGFVATMDGPADFLIDYLVKTRRTTEVHDIPASYSQETDWGRTGGGDQYSVQHTEETLVLMVLDPGARNQLWSASVEMQLPADLPADTLTKQMNEIIARMLRDFPPR